MICFHWRVRTHRSTWSEREGVRAGKTKIVDCFQVLRRIAQRRISNLRLLSRTVHSHQRIHLQACFSIPGRGKRSKMELVPGPGNYETNKSTLVNNSLARSVSQSVNHLFLIILLSLSFRMGSMNRVELGSSNGFPGVGSYHLSKSAERIQSRLPSYSIGFEERSSIGGNSYTPGVGVL